MFLLSRLLRPVFARVPATVALAILAALAVAAIAFLAVGLDTHDRIELRVGIGLALAALLSVRPALRRA